MQPASTASRTPAGKPKGRSSFRRRALFGIVGVGLAAGAAWWIFGYKAKEDPLAQYFIGTVDRGSVEDTVTAVGSLQPREYVDVGTQVSGQLRKLLVEVGQEVKQGDLLAEIDATVYQSRVEADRAQLENLEAQLLQREAELALAQQQFRRQKNLLGDNATSQDTFDTAEKTLRAAEGSVKAVKAQIREATSTLKGDEANLGYTKIYAPMSGTVVSQTSKQGQTLNANQSAPVIVRVADLSVMTVETQVSEADVSRLKLNMPAYFTTLGQPEKRWRGTLRKINPTPETENNVVLYNALFDVENPDGELMTDMTAQVFFVVASAENVVRVPVSALQKLQRPANAGTGDRRPGNGQVPAGARPSGEGPMGPPPDGMPPGPPPEGSPAGSMPPNGGAAPAGTRQASTATPGDQQGNRDGQRRQRRIVQIVKADGTIEDRMVVMGVSDRVNAEIQSGLQEGEKIVTGRRPSAAQMKAVQQQQQQQQQRMRPPGAL